jgi:hypothetical protein
MPTLDEAPFCISGVPSQPVDHLGATMGRTIPFWDQRDMVPDGTPKPPDDTFGYQPTAFPSARAPHDWLGPDQSILDLFSGGFVLLKFSDVPTASIEQAAARRGLPLAVHGIEHRQAAELYKCALVLVRPDGHVAWRGDRAPADALALIDTVRGAGPRIAARRADAKLVPAAMQTA